jgi:spore coat protein U-like protein
MRRRPALALAAGLLAAALVPGSSLAATSSSSFQVAATVSSYANVSTTTLAFGQYLPSADTLTTSNISVTASNSTSYTISINAGTSPGATTDTRKMTSLGSSTSTLGYQVYRDAARSNVWGSSASDMLSATGTGFQTTHTVYGKIPAGQFVAAGAYTDTLTVVVTY